MGLCFSQHTKIYHQYNMKLKWSRTIYHVQNQPNLCWVNLSKDHINPYLTPWSQLKGFNYRLLKPCPQNIYGSNWHNSLYNIMHIRDTTVDPYRIAHLIWPKSVDNVYLGHIIAACINMVLTIVTTILMVHSASPFWCEAPEPLKLICCCFFNRFSINYEVLKIPLSVWYNLITTTWIWSSLFNKALCRVWRHSIELKSNKFLN